MAFEMHSGLLDASSSSDTTVKKNNWFTSLAFLFLIFMVVALVVLYMYRQSLNDSLVQVESQLAQLEEGRDAETEARILALNQQLRTTGTILNNHVRWSEVFQGIANLILPRVQFTALSADFSRKEYRFEASADSFSTVAQQIAAFSNEESIAEVALEDTESKLDGRVNFSMILHLIFND